MLRLCSDVPSRSNREEVPSAQDVFDRKDLQGDGSFDEHAFHDGGRTFDSCRGSEVEEDVHAGNHGRTHEVTHEVGTVPEVGNQEDID